METNSIAELTKNATQACAEMAELRKSIAELNKPDFSRVSKEDEFGGRTASYWETTDETVEFSVTDDPDDKSATRMKSSRQPGRSALRRFIKAGYRPGSQFKSFADFVRDGMANHQTSEFKNRYREHVKAIQGMSETVGADGGFAVLPEFAPGIIDRIWTNTLWSQTDNYSVSGNSMTFLANAETSRATGSRSGGIKGIWQSEGGSTSGTKPTIRTVSLKLQKIVIVVYLTDELLSDSGMVMEQYVSRKAADEAQFLLGDAVVNGNGVGQPLGLLNCPSLVSVAKEQGQEAKSLYTQNIVKMDARLYAPNKGSSIWLHNQDVNPALYTMTLGVGTGGVTTYMPPGGLSSAPYATILGRPTLVTEFNSTLGTQGDIVLAALNQILSINKGEINQAVSTHVEFLTDQTALRFTMRVNATPWENAAITPYKGSSNTQSNFVTLDSRA